MELKKRDCGIKIDLTPIGVNFLGVDFDFYSKKFSFNPSSAAGGQFADFVSALYDLYYENHEGHDHCPRKEEHLDEENGYISAVTTTVNWDGESNGDLIIKMTRDYDENAHAILIKFSFDYGETFEEFTVHDKDLCYAVAKACTEVLKKYGLYGYRYTTAGDHFDLDELLFLKAYALDCPEVREFIPISDFTVKTNFENELKLLLFDM